MDYVIVFFSVYVIVFFLLIFFVVFFISLLLIISLTFEFMITPKNIVGIKVGEEIFQRFHYLQKRFSYLIAPIRMFIIVPMYLLNSFMVIAATVLSFSWMFTDFWNKILRRA